MFNGKAGVGMLSADKEASCWSLDAQDMEGKKIDPRTQNTSLIHKGLRLVRRVCLTVSSYSRSAGMTGCSTEIP